MLTGKDSGKLRGRRTTITTTTTTAGGTRSNNNNKVHILPSPPPFRLLPDLRL